MGCFDSLECGIKKVASWIGKLYQWPAVLAGQTALAFGGAVACGLILELPKPVNVFIISVFGFFTLVDFLALFKQTYRKVRKGVEIWVTQFKAMNMILRSAGFVGALKGFVALSSSVEKTKKLSLLAVGLMLSLYLCLATLVKLFGAKDIFGICDGIMALTVMTWVIMPDSAFQGIGLGHDPKNWAFAVFYFVAFLLSLFKSSEIELRGFDDDGHALPRQSTYLLPDGSTMTVSLLPVGSSMTVCNSFSSATGLLVVPPPV